MNEIGGTAPTAHVVPKSRHRSRYHTTSKLEAQTRRLEENHDDIVSDGSFRSLILTLLLPESHVECAYWVLFTAAILFDNELKTLDKQYEAGKSTLILKIMP